MKLNLKGKIMKLKAHHDLILPDGKTKIKIGDIFEYKGDISPFVSVVEVISDRKNEEQEKEIRERAKALGIRNYHIKGLEKLKYEIAEAESLTAAAVATEQEFLEQDDTTPASAPASAPAREEETHEGENV